MHQRSKRATTPLPRAAPPHRPNAPDGGGNTDGNATTAPGATRDVDGEKPDGGDGRGAGAINRAPTVALCHRRGAIYCALMGYIQGRGMKRGTTNALHPTAQSARMGRFFMGARASRSQECGQDARAPCLTNSLRPRLRRCLHVASTSPQCGSEAKRCFASHWGGFRLRRPKLRFGFPPPPSLGEGGLLRPLLRGGCHEVTGGVRRHGRRRKKPMVATDAARAR